MSYFTLITNHRTVCFLAQGMAAARLRAPNLVLEVNGERMVELKAN